MDRALDGVAHLLVQAGARGDDGGMRAHLALLSRADLTALQETFCVVEEAIREEWQGRLTADAETELREGRHG
jgi:hypothetical protein